jgi:hypothetical protein
MMGSRSITAATALAMIEAREAPFDFPSAKDCRSALTKLRKLDIPGARTRDLDVALTPKAVDALFARIERTPPGSIKERRFRANLRTRLNTLARIAAGIPAVSQAWAALEARLDAIAQAEAQPGQAFIAVTSTLKNAAQEDGLDPADLGPHWLAGRMRSASRKRRDSLLKAARILDALHPRLPAGLRPAAPFGDLGAAAGGARRSGALPPALAQDLQRYLETRCAPTTTPGLCGPVKLGDGIKNVSATIYDQALKWFVDSLRIGGLEDEIRASGIAELARLDWLSRAVFQAFDDHESDEEGRPTLLPWRPIAPKTVQSRAIALMRMFADVRHDFRHQTMPLLMHNGETGFADAKDLGKAMNARVEVGMTPANRQFCRALLSDRNRQRLLLNMHSICYEEASDLWSRFETLDRKQRRSAIDLCVLAAMLAIVVHIPFRARTLVELTFGGLSPDIVLPPRRQIIDLAVFRKRLKTGTDFDAVISDDAMSRPRLILDWFVAGPRQALLNDPELLAEEDRRPDRLFAGIDESRYGKILSEWTEKAGMRMTTHMFRHAIATLLVNVCGMALEDVALMLGNKVAAVERHYVMIDGVRRRTLALNRLAEHRAGLEDAKHPGRRGR